MVGAASGAGAAGLGNGIGLGIVGFGVMGERWLRALLDHPEPPLRAVAVWDPSPAAAARLSAAAPGVPMLRDAEAVIAACDLLYVASPPRSHLGLAGQAFEAGRAVLLEKPLSSDTAAARDFVAAAEARGARAGVNFPMASSPAVAQLAAWLPGIGAPRALAIEAAFAGWPRPWQRDAAPWLSRRAEGGFTREVLSHFLFLSRRLLGPLALEGGRAEHPAGDGAEVAVEARLRAGDVPATLRGRVGGTARDEMNAWTLRGERGAIRLRDWSVAERKGAQGWEAAPDALPQERARPLVLREQMRKAAAMARGEPHGLATLREALDVQEVVEAILAAG